MIEGELDLAIGRLGAVPVRVATRIIGRETLVVAVPASHPLAGNNIVEFKQLAEEKFIGLPKQPGAVLRERFFKLSQRHSLHLVERYTAPDTLTAFALVAAGVGVSLTLSTVRDSVHSSGVVFLDLADEVEPVQLSLAWDQGSNNPALQPILGLALALTAAVGQS